MGYRLALAPEPVLVMREDGYVMPQCSTRGAEAST
jgi:hypothetical protein